MLAKPVDPQRFRRAGLSARTQLRAARIRLVTQLEAAHREAYPLSWAYTGQDNLPRPNGWLELGRIAPGRSTWRHKGDQ